MIAGLFDAYPHTCITKTITVLFDAFFCVFHGICILKIGTYMPSSVALFKDTLNLKKSNAFKIVLVTNMHA